MKKKSVYIGIGISSAFFHFLIGADDTASTRLSSL